MAITFYSRGDFSKVKNYLMKNRMTKIETILMKYGDVGVDALAEATPKDTGLTANSWYYKIEKNKNSISLAFYNENNNQDVPIAILLQYGHATTGGTWVEGIDYINPAVRPIFEEIADNVWREVSG